MPGLTPAKATTSAGLRLASSALSVSGRAESATAAAIVGGVFWARAEAQPRMAANNGTMIGRIMSISLLLKPGSATRYAIDGKDWRGGHPPAEQFLAGG